MKMFVFRDAAQCIMAQTDRHVMIMEGVITSESSVTCITLHDVTFQNTVVFKCYFLLCLQYTL
jgi:hypothetical protein